MTNVLICRKKWNKKKLVKNKDRWKASQLITINNYNRLRNDLPSESLSSAQLQFVKTDNQVRKQDTVFSGPTWVPDGVKNCDICIFW